jgi:hypothetical protein
VTATVEFALPSAGLADAARTVNSAGGGSSLRFDAGFNRAEIDSAINPPIATIVSAAAVHVRIERLRRGFFFGDNRTAEHGLQYGHLGLAPVASERSENTFWQRVQR